MRLLIVIRCHLERPEITFHRGLAAGSILLRTVGGLVGRDLRYVLHAGGNGRADSAEALTLLYLRCLDSRGTFNLLTNKKTIAVCTGCLGNAVHTKQHFVARMMAFLARLR